MRSAYLSSSFSEDSGNDSDSSTASSRKRVQFFDNTTDTTDKSTSETRRPDVSRKSKKLLNCFKASSIDRGDMPDGSDVFRQALKEIQTQESESEGEKGSSAKCDSPPLKSILKKR